MTPKLDKEIRDVRALLAALIQKTITAMRPYLKANERGKVWTVDDREEVVERMQYLAYATAPLADAMEDIYKKKGLTPGERGRALQIAQSLGLVSGVARKVTFDEMLRYDAKYPPKRGEKRKAGQEFVVLTYAEVMLWIRRPLAGMFYLTGDTHVRVIRLTAAQAREFYNPKNRFRMQLELEEQARELAERTGNFVEVEVPDPDDPKNPDEVSVVADASPHAATVRKEMMLASRRAKRARMNPRPADYDVLLGMYSIRRPG
jgi:hypothetical protein